MASSGNVCINCGKQRVSLKSWDEKVSTKQGNAVLEYETFVCPDAECQKKVEASLAEKSKISQDREAAHQKRLKQRNEARNK